jgi:biotin carboxyl carrier protein
MRFVASLAGNEHELEIIQRDGAFECRLDGRQIAVDVTRIAPETLSILHEGKSYEVRVGANGAIAVGENSHEVSLTDPRSWRTRQLATSGNSGPQKLTASMPGKVVRVLVSPGSHVHSGQGLVVIEAMKMQNEIRAPRDGTVTAVLVQEGTAVNAGEVVAVLE